MNTQIGLTVGRRRVEEIKDSEEVFSYKILFHSYQMIQVYFLRAFFSRFPQL